MWHPSTPPLRAAGARVRVQAPAPAEPVTHLLHRRREGDQRFGGGEEVFQGVGALQEDHALSGQLQGEDVPVLRWVGQGMGVEACRTRCHGDSAPISCTPPAEHTMASAPRHTLAQHS